MRLIDADACEEYFYDHMTDAAMAVAMCAIDEMPTIDVDALIVSAFNSGYNYAKAEKPSE